MVHESILPILKCHFRLIYVVRAKLTVFHQIRMSVYVCGPHCVVVKVGIDHFFDKYSGEPNIADPILPSLTYAKSLFLAKIIPVIHRPPVQKECSILPNFFAKKLSAILPPPVDVFAKILAIKFFNRCYLVNVIKLL